MLADRMRMRKRKVEEASSYEQKIFFPPFEKDYSSGFSTTPRESDEIIQLKKNLPVFFEIIDDQLAEEDMKFKLTLIPAFTLTGVNATHRRLLDTSTTSVDNPLVSDGRMFFSLAISNPTYSNHYIFNITTGKVIIRKNNSDGDILQILEY